MITFISAMSDDAILIAFLANYGKVQGVALHSLFW